MWWLLPPLLYAKGGSEDARVKAITDTRTALLAGLVGLGALGTFWLNSRIHGITVRTFEVTERGHVTDRYSKAIEQLGSDSLDIRLGGIYALEQIAKDSVKHKEDQSTIVGVLSAFVRVHSDPIYRYRASLAPATVPLDEEKYVATLGARYMTEVTKLPVDVQAAVTVLGRLPYDEKIPRGDLTGANLTEADLRGADLRGADLRGADLGWAKLDGAKLGGAKLHGAKLGSTDVTAPQLEGTLGDPETQLPLGVDRPENWNSREGAR